MNLTNFLLSIIVAILVAHYYPAAAEALGLIAFGCFVLYACYFVAAHFPAYLRNRKAKRAQDKKFREEFDIAELLAYRQKYKAIRDKYDPERKWNETTTVPKEYFSEIDSLQYEHQSMIELLEKRGSWCEGGYFVDYSWLNDDANRNTWLKKN